MVCFVTTKLNDSVFNPERTKREIHQTITKKKTVVHFSNSDLEPYSEYEVKIQAFTTQVSFGGFGTLSPPQTFQTAEGRK